MIKNLRPPRPAVAILLVLAVLAVACGEQEAQLPIEPAGPRPAPATSTTATEPAPEEEVVVEVPTVTPPTEPEVVLVAVESPPAEAATDPDPDLDVPETTEPVEEGLVVMNTWVDDPTVTAATVAPTTTAAPTTPTTTGVVPVSTIVVVPETTTTVAPPTTTTTTTVAPTTTTTTAITVPVATSGVDAPPIPRPGDEGVPEVNDDFGSPIQVDLSWFPETKNVISWGDWNRVDEENTPEWARQEGSGRCPPRNWWSYPLTIQVGTVLANAPRGVDCFSASVPQSYVVTRMWHTPVCDEDDNGDRCLYERRPEASHGVDVWRIVLCGYTFEGEWNDFGISYRVKAMRQDDGRFRVVVNSFFSQRECNR